MADTTPMSPGEMLHRLEGLSLSLKVAALGVSGHPMILHLSGERVSLASPALEQAMEILEVVTHQRFYGIDNGSVGIRLTDRLVEWKSGSTIIEAFRKAHEAIKEAPSQSEGSEEW